MLKRLKKKPLTPNVMTKIFEKMELAQSSLIPHFNEAVYKMELSAVYNFIGYQKMFGFIDRQILESCKAL